MKCEVAYKKWIEAKDVDEFTRAELAEMLDAFLEEVGRREIAAQPSVQADACAMSEKCANVGVDDFGKCWHCGKPRR
jgi:hypothetical protein